LNIDVGTIIAGKYELVRLIGKGAMGEVWLATHSSLGEKFAIKLVEPTDDIEAETAAGRFQLEAQIAAKLSRKTRHIVSVSDHGEENGLAYLVMELLEGESLEARVRRDGALPTAEVAAIVSQVARALSLAHDEGIFHRDLKPANVFLTHDEDGRLIVKLLDFGIARALKPFKTRSPFATSKDMVLGTPSYMSPEQARGLDSLDYRCDLWALAVVAYEALTKSIPFEGDTVEDIFLSICTFRVVPVRARRAELSESYEAFFATAFAANIEDRFRTAADLSAGLEALVPPHELEEALGGPLPSPRGLRIATPVSFRSPSASKPTLVGPLTDQNVTTQPEPKIEADRLRESPPPSYFEQGIDSTSFRDETSKRRGGGWIIVAAGGIASVAILILALVAFRGSSNANAAAASAATTGIVAKTTTPEATPPLPPQPTIEIVEVPAPKTAPAKPGAKAHAPTNAAPAPKPAPAPPPTTAAKPAPAPPPATPEKPAAPPPAPAPTQVNKSGVF
jgi:eukaryotic-like serine/threonine-protein kinase